MGRGGATKCKCGSTTSQKQSNICSISVEKIEDEDGPQNVANCTPTATQFVIEEKEKDEGASQKAPAPSVCKRDGQVSYFSFQ